MAIPEPIETFMDRLGFDYARLEPRAPAPGAPAEATPSEVCTHAFMADRVPVLAVTPAASLIDAERLRQLAGAREMRPATDEELRELCPESEPGAMPPLGPLYGQRVFADEALARAPEIAFTAGTRRDAIRMRVEDFTALVHPTIGRFAVPARKKARMS